MSAEALRSLENPFVLDVRDPSEVEAGKGGPPSKIEGSVNVPLNIEGQKQSDRPTTLGEFQASLSKAGLFEAGAGLSDKSRAVVTHCGAGGRGGRAAELLSEMGFVAVFNGGGPKNVHDGLC